MRIALDTNVLISAYTTRGLSSDVFRLILAEHELVLPRVVLEEFGRVLIDKFGVPDHYVAEFADELSQHGIVDTPDAGPGLETIRDPDDRLVVRAAAAGRAEILITGDRDILDVRDRMPLAVKTPREFWESLRTDPDASTTR